MIELDENTLLAYVDGQLDADRRREVEAALANDARAQEIVHKLRRTPDALKPAFDGLLAHRLPPTLAERILQYEIHSTPEHRRWLLAGVVAMVFTAGIGAGYFLGLEGPRTERWLLAVAHYQALYSRDTLNQPDPPNARVRETELRLGEQLGFTLHIPDLSGHGFDFKRGQLLELDNQPLIQLAYLPRQGKPLAYCIRRSTAPDLPPSIGEAEGLRFIHWRKAGYAHVIIGDFGFDTLRTLAATATESKKS